MCLRIGKLHIKCLASRAAKQSDRPYTAMIASGSQRGKRARQHNNGLCSGVRGAPGEIRTPDPQIRSLVLYPAELRARRVLAIGFAAYWQARAVPPTGQVYGERALSPPESPPGCPAG